MPDHVKWMKVAIALAKRGLGSVSPNPSVGCLIVKGNCLVGRGWTQPGGRPHAETGALEMAGEAAKGATAYVTLEPCSHTGETPPCAKALVAAGLKQVVIAVQDPDPRVSGRGVAALREAGIKTTVGVLEDEARQLNAGFFLKTLASRPLFTLKTAATLDGKIATVSGESKWITSKKARDYGHLVRAQHDAILVGINTVIADNPTLTCRIEGLENRSPAAVVLDSKLRTPVDCELVKKAGERPFFIICNKSEASGDAADKLSAAGAQLITVPDTRDPRIVGKQLVKQGFTRVLVEGGGQVLASFVTARLCDRLLAFTSGKIIGADGLANIGPLALAELGDAPHLTLESYRRLGPDLLASYVNAE